MLKFTFCSKCGITGVKGNIKCMKVLQAVLNIDHQPTIVSYSRLQATFSVLHRIFCDGDVLTKKEAGSFVG